jgi:hypothetical protein
MDLSDSSKNVWNSFSVNLYIEKALHATEGRPMLILLDSLTNPHSPNGT